MGLALSILLSAWNEILRRNLFGIPVQTVITRSLSFERREGALTFRTISFKKENSESAKCMFDGSQTFPKSDKPKLKTSVPIEDLVLEKECMNSGSFNFDNYNHEPDHLSKPTPSVPEPFVFSSPRPIHELDAAATTLQKVYKSYRTRRNLADCAVVVEELWWKTLDSAALKQSSISFFNIEKPETASSRWARARTRAAKVGKGLSKDEKAQKLALQHWLEAIDPRHRYGHNLHFYYDVWSGSMSTQPFFYWLDVGDGKELNLQKCPRNDLQRQCINYLGPKEREAYEVVVEDGKLIYKQSGILLNTVEGSKWIFVLSTSRNLYVGQKKKGVFQHSSFLSGGATTAAGRLVAHEGILEAIWPYSGHYLPTEDNFKEFISFLEENLVDLIDVKRCAVDDDRPSFKAVVEESKSEMAESLSITKRPTNSDADSKTAEDEGDVAASAANNNNNTEPPVFDLAKRLSCKWTSGLGPRIGCVRDYPSDLQSRALEQVNLSPKVDLGQNRNCLPIPSPRPSPKIRVSPRLAYMGIPSPRVTLSTAC